MDLQPSKTTPSHRATNTHHPHEQPARVLQLARLGEHHAAADSNALDGAALPYWVPPSPPSLLEHPLVDAVAALDLAAHALHSPVHWLVGLEDPAHLAALPTHRRGNDQGTACRP